MNPNPRHRVCRKRLVDLFKAGYCDAQIARLLESTTKSVAMIRLELGLRRGRKKRRLPHIDGSVISDMVKSGLGDKKIARVLGISHGSVRNLRIKYGIRPSRKLTRVRDVDPISYGLPNWLTATQTLIMVSLADGPKDAKQLRVAVGYPPRRSGQRIFTVYRGGIQVNAMTELVDAGLVANCVREKAGESGACPKLYTLTIPAIDMMANSRG